MDYYETRITESKEVPPPAELPETYNQDILVFMVRDPYWVYAYWGIKEETQKAIMARLGEQDFYRSRLQIKIFQGQTKADLEKSPQLHMELDVTGPARSWYIHLGQPDKAFYGILGFLTPGGEFIEIARSNSVLLPRDTVSSQVDAKWMSSEETYEKMLSLRRQEGASPMEWGERKKEIHRKLFEAPGSFTHSQNGLPGEK